MRHNKVFIDGLVKLEMEHLEYISQQRLTPEAIDRHIQYLREVFYRPPRALSHEVIRPTGRGWWPLPPKERHQPTS